MNKMYKLFGAVAIIGLFLIGSMSTVLAASQDQVEVKSQPAVPDAEPQSPEPLGIIPADLYMTAIYRRPVTQIVLVDVINQGLGCAWMPWRLHVYVTGIFNGDWAPLVIGPVFPSQIKTFSSPICLAGSIPRYTTVTLDETNNVFEGILGELNNQWSGFV